MSTIEQIKAEIEGWLREYAEDSQFELGERYGYKRLLSFLSTLESEKPMNQDDASKYKNSVINSLRKKRVFPTLKGEQLHKFKNEVNTLKQILQPWQTYGNIQAELFEQFALAFAVWGSYNLDFRAQDNEFEDSRDLQNQERLEEELDNWRHEHFHGKRDDHFSGEYLERTSQLDLARHFAQWGAEHLKK